MELSSHRILSYERDPSIRTHVSPQHADRPTYPSYAPKCTCLGGAGRICGCKNVDDKHTLTRLYVLSFHLVRFAMRGCGGKGRVSFERVDGL